MKCETTEARNPSTMDLDLMSPLEIVTAMNREDGKIAAAVEKALPEIAEAAEKIAGAFRNGGRLIYAGAGTSGRLGVLDASECPPTFGVSEEQVRGIIAGGSRAIVHAVENAEDSEEDAVKDLKEIGFCGKDVLVGIAASGSTPYVLGAIRYASSFSAVTVSVAMAENSLTGDLADIRIEAVTGPEVLTGSTRLKAGTATKMILNMLTTAAMVLSGRCYGNLMVDLKATNEKLRKRSVRIVREAAETDEETAAEALEKAGGSVKTAIVMLLFGEDPASAEALLEAADGRIRAVRPAKKGENDG